MANSMREDERLWASLAHLVAAIPLWGVVGDTAIWLYFKERSRDVVFHAQQAIFFQAGVLAIGLVWVLVGMLQKIISVISAGVGSLVATANNFFLIVFLILYACVCLFGAYKTWSGGTFLYPVIGARMAEGFRRVDD